MNKIATTTESPMMTSLQIAEVTGRQHSNVMRDIRNLIEQVEDINQFSFELVDYIDKKGEKRPCYRLTKKDCLLLASGYDANLRAKIINRLEELEKVERARQPKVPTTFKEALLLAVAQQEQIEQQQKLIIEKAEQLDESMEWFSIKRWAKLHHKNWRTYK